MGASLLARLIQSPPEALLFDRVNNLRPEDGPAVADVLATLTGLTSIELRYVEPAGRQSRALYADRQSRTSVTRACSLLYALSPQNALSAHKRPVVP
jgi:hypothetical protein